MLSIKLARKQFFFLTIKLIGGFKMSNLGYYNGEIKQLEELKVPATDRAFYFGDGIYEVAFAINQKPFALDEHMDRLFSSCEMLDIKPKMSKNEIKDLILNLLKQQNSKYQKIYWQISRGSAIRQHTFLPEIESNLFIAITEEKIKNMRETKFKLISIPDTRFLHCNIKTLNLIPSIMASQKAKNSNADEAVLHRDEVITECAHSNISIIKNDELQTAPANNLILPGITRKHLIEICNQLNIKVVEKPFTLQQLFDCDEAIVSASGILFMEATILDEKSIGGKNQDLLHKIQTAYEEKILESCGQLLY